MSSSKTLDLENSLIFLWVSTSILTQYEVYIYFLLCKVNNQIKAILISIFICLFLLKVASSVYRYDVFFLSI